MGTVTRTATVMRSTTTFTPNVLPNRLWWELISQMKQRIRIPSPIHLELIVISANISPIFLNNISASKNENLVENWMGSYITQERADHGPITNPSGTHIRPNISPVFLKITSPEEGKQKCKYDLVQNRKTQLISTIEAPIHLGPTTIKCDFG